VRRRQRDGGIGLAVLLRRHCDSQPFEPFAGLVILS